MDARGRGDSLVLFVHGAHHAGWCWLLVMDQIERMGIASQAIDLPFTGYDDDVAAVRAAIAAAGSRGPPSTSCATATPGLRWRPAVTGPPT